MINLVAVTNPVAMDVPVALVPLAMQSPRLAVDATEKLLMQQKATETLKVVVAVLLDATEPAETTETIEKNKIKIL